MHKILATITEFSLAIDMDTKSVSLVMAAYDGDSLHKLNLSQSIRHLGAVDSEQVAALIEMANLLRDHIREVAGATKSIIGSPIYIESINNAILSIGSIKNEADWFSPEAAFKAVFSSLYCVK